MAYTLSTSISLGPSKTGLTLRARLIDTLGNIDSEISTGFIEIGGGNYLWTYDYPTGFRGGIKIYEDGVPGTILSFFSINPQEAENIDVPFSEAVTEINETINNTSGINIEVGHSNASGIIRNENSSESQNTVTVSTGVR